MGSLEMTSGMVVMIAVLLGSFLILDYYKSWSFLSPVWSNIAHDSYHIFPSHEPSPTITTLFTLHTSYSPSPSSSPSLSSLSSPSPSPSPLNDSSNTSSKTSSNIAASSLRTPLERLEAGLDQVRASLCRLSRTNKTDFKEEISGPIYRNAVLFQKSYREMERRMKIFVYGEGENPLAHNGPCKDIYAIEGRFIQELSHYGGKGKNPFVTMDPQKAHLFFLPFSVSMMVSYLYREGSHDWSPLLRYAKGYVNAISSKYPYWNRSSGADHFMLSCHDWAPTVSAAHPDLWGKAIRVLCNANVSEGYVPWKDASLPEINLLGGQAPTGSLAEPLQEGEASKSRPHLAFFAGRDHGPVRPILYQYWEGGMDTGILVFRTLPSNLSYASLMKGSKFCLCPGGYEVNSPRLVEAIYNGCVPVVIADNFVLPFSDVLDWPTFSLHIPEREIPNLNSILRNVLVNHTTGLLETTSSRDTQPYYRHYDYEDMVKRVQQVRHHFSLNQPPQKYDAFHMILHSLWLRRLNFQLR